MIQLLLSHKSMNQINNTKKHCICVQPFLQTFVICNVTLLKKVIKSNACLDSRQRHPFWICEPIDTCMALCRRVSWGLIRYRVRLDNTASRRHALEYSLTREEPVSRDSVRETLVSTMSFILTKVHSLTVCVGPEVTAAAAAAAAPWYTPSHVNLAAASGTCTGRKRSRGSYAVS